MKNKTLIIDFDSTFIQTEALDELAIIALENHPQREKIVNEIREITSGGMDGRIPLNESLTRRLTLLKANKKHIEKLINQLKNQITNSFLQNAPFLKKFSDHIYIVSSGFKEYIIPVVKQFGIKDEHVFANTFHFDAQGNVIGLDDNNPLSQNQGKVKLVKSLHLTGEVCVIGDGITDYEIRKANAAHVFFAFTENVRREKVTAKADHILKNFDEYLYMNDYPQSTSMPRNQIKILLLENIHSCGVKLLENEGFSVETFKGSLNEVELCEKIQDVNVLGIRSKTIISKKILMSAKNLMCVGAFCVGINKIDLETATKNGVCVFNAPYSNTRSVVKMVIGEIIMLMRKIASKNLSLHNGKWDKSANNCYEVRGKKLGIIGYGNIGSQLSVVAESLGLQVYYYDLIERLQLGNSKKCHSLDELLQLSDIVSVHVDGRKQNENMIDHAQFQQMKKNVVFINLSRGNVVNVDALVNALKNGKILGAAIDVFPHEPIQTQEEFITPLRDFSNVILTPHIGGNTEEAQFNIGEFVARRIIDYVNTGDSMQSVNFPNIQLSKLNNTHRLIHLHDNVPVILAQINQVLANHHVNLLGQYLKTKDNIGYVISDIDMTYDKSLLNEICKIKHTIKSYILF